jgi:multiple sugar transport system ATP-binding protein
MSAVSVSGLSKSFGHLRVLKDIHLPIEAGDFTVLLGPSGCGKSTLLNAIAGLEDTDAGIIQIDGADVTHIEPSKRGIAMVFQSYALYPTMSVRKNLSAANRRAARSQTIATFRWAKAARRHRPCAGAAGQGVPVRRTAIQPRRQTAY